MDSSVRKNNVCRTCLSEASSFKSLLSKMEGDDRTLCEVLSFVINIDISNNADYPKQVCNECHIMICKADEFKKRCIQTESILESGIFTRSFDELIKNEIVNNSDFILTKTQIPIENQIVDDNSFTKYQKKNNSQSLDVEIPAMVTLDSLNSDNYSVYENFIKEESDEFLHDDIEAMDNILIENRQEYGEKINLSDSNICECGFLCLDRTEFETHKIECKGSVDKYNKHSIKLTCPICNEDFHNLDLLEVHVQIHKDNLNGTSDYQCPKCDQKFECKSLFITHLKTHKNKIRVKHKNVTKTEDNMGFSIPLNCGKCQEQFPHLEALTLHMKIHLEKIIKSNEIKNYQCSLCMRKFVRKTSLIAHISRHEDKSRTKYTCKTCKRDFLHQAHLDNHITVAHSKEKGFSCDQCRKSFATQECLDHHKDSHKVDKKHQCKVCAKTFAMLCTLKEHMRTHTGEKPFLCSICGRGFSQKNNLAEHMRRHQGLKPFKCENCERRFVSKGELDAHTRKHSGAHPFVCDECGNSFTTSSSLTKHRRIHSGERPYACDLCSMRFTALGTLKNHRRTHTGEKPYQCSHCEKAFIQRTDLVTHIRCHTGERPYVCTSCGQAFRKASALKVHIKIHGKEPLIM